MSALDRDTAAVPSSVTDDLAEACQWVSSAHDSGDLEQGVAARYQLYALLTTLGWTPPPRAAALLRVRSAAIDLELSTLVDP